MQPPIRSTCRLPTVRTAKIRGHCGRPTTAAQRSAQARPCSSADFLFLRLLWIRRRTMRHLRLRFLRRFPKRFDGFAPSAARGHRCRKIDRRRRAVRVKIPKFCLVLRQTACRCPCPTANGFADWLCRQQSVRSPASLVLKTKGRGQQTDWPRLLHALENRLAAAQTAGVFRLSAKRPNSVSAYPPAPCPNSASCCCRLVQIRRSCAMHRQFVRPSEKRFRHRYYRQAE